MGFKESMTGVDLQVFSVGVTCSQCNTARVVVTSLTRHVEHEFIARALDALAWIQIGEKWICPDCQDFSLGMHGRIHEACVEREKKKLKAEKGNR